MISKNKQFANMEDMMPLIRESLKAGQKVQFSPRGKSMLPLIREGKDSVILSQVKEPLKPYDLVLYQRNDGKYILHRIVSLDGKGGYVCMGDHQLVKEYGIRDENIIAVASGFYRGSKEHQVSEKIYRLYASLWYQGRRGIRLMRRIGKKVRRK